MIKLIQVRGVIEPMEEAQDILPTILNGIVSIFYRRLPDNAVWWAVCFRWPFHIRWAPRHLGMKHAPLLTIKRIKHGGHKAWHFIPKMWCVE